MYGLAVDLSIVVVNWNTRDSLAACLQAIHQHAGSVSYEVFVVDNASIDGSVALVQQEFPWVHLIGNAENVGFARANNAAMQLCRGHAVLLLNSDAYVTAGALDGMLCCLQEHPDAGITGPRLSYPDGRPQFCAGTFPDLLSECRSLMGLSHWDMASWDLGRPVDVDWVSGACLMIRRACLDELGGLDESFFMFAEEVDLCYRARRAGWRVVLSDCRPVLHGRAGSTGQTPGRVVRLYRGKASYLRKHYGAPAERLYDLAVVLASLLKVLAYGLWRLSGRGDANARYHLWLTVCQLWLQQPRPWQSATRPVARQG